MSTSKGNWARAALTVLLALTLTVSPLTVSPLSFARAEIAAADNAVASPDPAIAPLPPVTDTLAAPSAGAQGILYRADKDGKTVYLLGSIHVGTDVMSPFSQRIENALASSEAYVFECDLEDTSEALALTAFMFQTDGTRLQDIVSAETYARCEQVGRQMGLSLLFVPFIKPWALYAAFTSLAYQSLIGNVTAAELDAYGVDTRVLAEGKERGKSLLYLETAMEQYQTLDAMSRPLQEYLLDTTARAILSPSDVQGFDATIGDWPRWWAAGDAAAFRDAYALDTDETAEKAELNAEYQRLLLTERNERMAARLDDLVRTREEKTFLVTVGLLHLVLAEDSVLTRLQSRGYTVSEVAIPEADAVYSARRTALPLESR